MTIRTLSAGTLLLISILAATATAAEVPYITGTGWREFTVIHGGDRLNLEGEFTFTVYPGQEAVLTVTDYGWNHEAYEIYDNGSWTGWSTNGASTGLWTSSYETSSTSGPWGAVQKPLSPGNHRLRIQVQRSGGSTRSDVPGQSIQKGAFKVTILQTPDADSDKIADTFETGTGIYISPVDTGTDPAKPDTDGDGLQDWAEIFTHSTDPNNPDTDGDGFRDMAEITAGKSPTNAADNPEAAMEVATAIEVTLYTKTGTSYQLEWSEDMKTWTAFPEIITGDGDPVTRFYSTKNHPHRYFRAAKMIDP